MADAATADVASLGPEIEVPDCPQKVNAGFMQVLSRTQPALRVYERGAGETLACGTGLAPRWWRASGWAGWMRPIEVDTRGGRFQHRMGRHPASRCA